MIEPYSHYLFMISKGLALEMPGDSGRLSKWVPLEADSTVKAGKYVFYRMYIIHCQADNYTFINSINARCFEGAWTFRHNT